MTRTISTLLTLSLLLTLVSAQGRPPYSTNNAQSACVQYGGCSTNGGNGVLTATQNYPVTPPAGTPALATFTTLDSSFISSLAAAGASSAYSGNGGSSYRGSSTFSAGGSSNTGGSGGSGSSSTGIGSLGGGSSNAAQGTFGGVVMGLAAMSVAAVLGAAMLL